MIVVAIVDGVLVAVTALVVVPALREARREYLARREAEHRATRSPGTE